jgi:hypothetical protein
MAISLERHIAFFQQIPGIWQYLSDAVQQLQNGINTVAENTASALGTKMAPPPPIDNIDVKASGGLLHVTLADHNTIQKGINYFVEHSTRPDFVGAHVVHINASRGTTLTLPGLTDEGDDQPVYVRGYSQYQGSNPSKAVAFGGAAPTPVLPGGTTRMTLLPSTGSGTAITNGQQQGYGLGRSFTRQATQFAKRQAAA